MRFSYEQSRKPSDMGNYRKMNTRVVMAVLGSALITWAVTFWYLGVADEWCLNVYEDCQADLMSCERN